MTDELDRIARAYRSYEEERAGDRWSLTNAGNRAALRERENATRRMLQARGWIPLGSRRILEVGSGSGRELARLVDFGADPANLVGVDLLAERVAAARAAYPHLDINVANAEHLHFADASFDMVMAITLFSSIKDHVMARNVAREIVRVVKAGGAILWYDFRYDNPRNPYVRGLSGSAVRSLFPELEGKLVPVTLLPPVSRRLGRLTSFMYPALSAVPALRTHLLGLLTKPR